MRHVDSYDLGLPDLPVPQGHPLFSRYEAILLDVRAQLKERLEECVQSQGSKPLPAAQAEASRVNPLARSTTASESARGEELSSASVPTDCTSGGAEQSDSTTAFELTRSEPSPKYDRKLLAGTLAAGLLITVLVGVFGLVACTAMPSASVAFISGIGIGQPDYVYSSLIPVYCPGSEGNLLQRYLGRIRLPSLWRCSLS